MGPNLRQVVFERLNMITTPGFARGSFFTDCLGLRATVELPGPEPDVHF